MLLPERVSDSPKPERCQAGPSGGFPGFRPIARQSVERFLPPGKSFKPTLCISDTHLLPQSKSYGSDLPHEVLEVLCWYAGHQVFILGDLVESLIMTGGEIRRLDALPAFAAILEELRWRSGVRFVPGNHDIWAVRALKRHLGARRVLPGGFRIGNLLFVHGHETGLDSSPVAERMPRLVALGGHLTKIGLQSSVGIASNQAISAQYANRRMFPIFGHTHQAQLTARFANCGCFLKAARSFITLEGCQLTLWSD